MNFGTPDPLGGDTTLPKGPPLEYAYTGPPQDPEPAWTSTPPTDPGFYWMDRGDDMIPVRMPLNPLMDSFEIDCIKRMGYKFWPTPIPEPPR